MCESPLWIDAQLNLLLQSTQPFLENQKFLDSADLPENKPYGKDKSSINSKAMTPQDRDPSSRNIYL